MSIASSAGFTIPELIIAVSISTVLLGLLFGPLDDLYKSSGSGLRSIVQTADTRGALRRIEHNISLSDKFLPSNNNNISSSDNISDTANGGTSWNWQGPTNSANNRVLITQNYATDSSGNTLLTSPACDVTTPQTIQYIYFVQNQSLYRRTLVASSYPNTCSGTSVANKQTCPPALTRSSACQANDALIAKGVVNFAVDYYTSATTSTPLDNGCGDGTHTCYTNGSSSNVPTSARSIVVSITITTGTGTNAVSSSSQMRLTRING